MNGLTFNKGVFLFVLDQSERLVCGLLGHALGNDYFLTYFRDSVDVIHIVERFLDLRTDIFFGFPRLLYL